MVSILFRTVPGLLVILLIRGNIEGDRDNREDTSIRISRKQPLFLQSSHLMFHQSVHTYILSGSLTLPKRFEWITFPFLPLIMHCRKSKSGQYRLKLTGQNAPLHTRKLLCWPADSHSVTRSMHSSSSRRLPATWVVKRWPQVGNSQSEQKGR